MLLIKSFHLEIKNSLNYIFFFILLRKLQYFFLKKIIQLRFLLFERHQNFPEQLNEYKYNLFGKFVQKPDLKILQGLKTI